MRHELRKAKVKDDPKGREVTLLYKNQGYEIVDEYTVPTKQLRMAEFKSILVDAWYRFDEITTGPDWIEASVLDSH